MISTSCMRSLGLRCIFEVDGWTQALYRNEGVMYICVDIHMMIEGISCGESVAWEI
jgi:hypothetical protein